MEAVASDVDQCAGGRKPRTPTCGRHPLIEEADGRDCDEKPNQAHVLIVDPAASLRNLMSKDNEVSVVIATTVEGRKRPLPECRCSSRSGDPERVQGEGGDYSIVRHLDRNSPVPHGTVLL